MANEIYPFPNHTIRAQDEATYNAATTLTASDTKTVLEATVNSEIATINPRAPIAAKRAGSKGYKGTTRAEWSIVSEVQFAPTVATAPDCHQWLVASGWVSSYATDDDYDGPFHSPDGSNDDQIRTYTLGSKDEATYSSIKIHYDQINSATTKAYHQSISGCRGDWSLSMVGGETLKLSVEGSGIAATPTDEAVTPATGAYTIGGEVMSLSTALSSQTPACCVGTKFEIKAIDPVGSSDVTFGSLSMLNALRALEISGNMNVVEDIAFNASGGIGRVRHAPAEPFTATMDLELVSVSEFDLKAYQKDQWLIQSKIVFINGTSVIELYFQSTISSVTTSEADGLIVASLELVGAWEESATDGGGLVPSDTVTLKFIGVV